MAAISSCSSLVSCSFASASASSSLLLHAAHRDPRIGTGNGSISLKVSVATAGAMARNDIHTGLVGRWPMSMLLPKLELLLDTSIVEVGRASAVVIAANPRLSIPFHCAAVESSASQTASNGTLVLPPTDTLVM
eukprot:GDKJ01047429.1.p3 GENE.GDKJ01047429.1~~GDKJ01047429.1.p3  ORF type:complete len:134 (+),score=5.36 GDKJ01047429.1:712-1113(+)